MWRAGTGQPRVHQQLRHLQPLCRRLPQHAANQTLGLRGKPIRQAESPATDLGEQHSGSRVLKWVSPDEHGVKGHAQTPDVCSTARVRAFPVSQQLRADVGRAAMSVRQRVIIHVAMKEDGVIEAEQRKFCPAGTKGPIGQSGKAHRPSQQCSRQYCSISNISPVLVREDEPAELQVSQNDSVLVTVCYGVQHLSEQVPRLVLAQTLPAAHICVHVAMVTRQEDVHAVPANHHVQQAADVAVVTDAAVGSQPLLVTTQWKHL